MSQLTRVDMFLHSKAPDKITHLASGLLSDSCKLFPKMKRWTWMCWFVGRGGQDLSVNACPYHVFFNSLPQQLISYLFHVYFIKCWLLENAFAKKIRNFKLENDITSVPLPHRYLWTALLVFCFFWFGSIPSRVLCRNHDLTLNLQQNKVCLIAAWV